MNSAGTLGEPRQRVSKQRQWRGQGGRQRRWRWQQRWWWPRGAAARWGLGETGGSAGLALRMGRA